MPGNKIGDVGAQALGEALKENLSLKELFLYKNQIGDIGAQSIADGLKNHPAILSLDILLWNNIGSTGDSALNEAKNANSNWATLK